MRKPGKMGMGVGGKVGAGLVMMAVTRAENRCHTAMGNLEETNEDGAVSWGWQEQGAISTPGPERARVSGTWIESQ